MKLFQKSRAFVAISALFALILSFFSGSAALAAIPDTVTVTVHYHRTASDYDNWNVFTWKNLNSGNDGSSPTFPFTGTDSFGAVVTFSVDAMSNYDNLGFILRPGSDWNKADRDQKNWPANGDRFISSFDSSGKAEIWLLQGDVKIYTSAPAIAAVTPKILSAVINDFKTINVTLNTPIKLAGTATEGFSVTASSGASVSVSSVSLPTGKTESNLVTLNLASSIDVTTSYTIAQTTFGSASVSVGAIMDSKAFADAYTYTGDDLGNTYSAFATKFRVWAPTASAVTLNTYATLATRTPVVTNMTKDVNGTWVATLTGDQNGTIYTYKATVGGVTREAVDPYVRSTTIEGDKGVVLDLSKTNPAEWATTAKPAFSGNAVDAWIYELHVRDLSIASDSGVPAAHRGKFLALTDWNTTATKTVTNPKTKKKTTVATKNVSGISAIKDLGVTHVQLLPIYDFASVSESKPSFNWGYDPKNYNVPEGSYSTNPSDPTARVSELKQSVQSLHANGLRAVMDVVYNHVSSADDFSFQQLVPGYFFRTTADGSMANGTYCGNEVASERAMVRKFIVDSVKYWASEYKLDGFRFDLMGILDVTTMNQIRTELDKIDPSILVIGEGWNMGDVLPEAQRGTQVNASKLGTIGMFNDQIRDAIKGSVFDSAKKGYVQGNYSELDSVKAGIVGQILYSRAVNGNWTASAPGQSVNYVEAHDNMTLWDKLKASMRGASTAKLTATDQLAASIAFLSQGVPFQHAGQEFLRTKNGDGNSYNSGDGVNKLQWNSRATNISTVNYYKGLIALRMGHKAFRMATADQVKANLTFLATSDPVIAYSLNGAAVGDSWNTIVVAHNPGLSAYKLTLPSSGSWQTVVTAGKAGVTTLATVPGNTVTVPAGATLVVHN
jgi:pullulanase